MSLKLRWLGTACFEIVLPDGQTVVIDPYVDDSVSAPIHSGQFEACDYIFITHGHYDQVPEQFEWWMTTYPGGEQLNFVFEPTGGKRVYMAGTYPRPAIIEAARAARAHITLLQVLAGNTVHGMEEEIAGLAVASGCRIVIPQHHDPLFQGSKKTDLSELKKIIAEKSNINFKELVPGKWYVFE